MNKEDLIPIDLFCFHHGIEVNFILDLKDYGMIEIIVLEEKEYFSVEQLASIEKIIRLHHDLKINLEGIDIILNLLSQMDDFKSKLTTAHNKLNFFENTFKQIP